MDQEGILTVCKTRSNHCILCWILNKVCEGWRDKPIEDDGTEVDGLVKLGGLSPLGSVSYRNKTGSPCRHEDKR